MTSSLAFRTDLALRIAQGALVTREGGDATVVRMPGNPAFRWGDFLLVPEAGDPEERIRRHAAEFPGAGFGFRETGTQLQLSRLGGAVGATA